MDKDCILDIRQRIIQMDVDKCVGGGKCEKLCPMNNIKIVDKKVVQNNQCTTCVIGASIIARSRL